MTHYIYVIQNKINLKIYVGKTNNPDKRYKDHIYITNNSTNTNKFLIHRAINKYGKDNFLFQVIEEFENELDCLEAEKFWIEFFRSDINRFGSEYGYNLTAGGDGILGLKHSQQAKNKISKANKGRIFDQETRYRMSESHKGKPSSMLGHKQTNKQKKIQSERNSGSKNYFYGKKFIGIQNATSVLNEKQVIEIILLLKDKTHTQKEISKIYNVSLLTISRIKRGKTYTNITSLYL